MGPLPGWSDASSTRATARFPDHRDRVRVLSPTHGLLRADELINPIPEPGTFHSSPTALRNLLNLHLATDILKPERGIPREVLLLGDELALYLIADLLGIPERQPRLHWFRDSVAWSHTAAILDHWGWP